MRAEDFVKCVQVYYGGKYESELEVALIMKYLDGFKNLEWLFDRLVLRFSKRWKILPDIATIEEIVNDENSYRGTGVKMLESMQIRVPFNRKNARLVVTHKE